MIDRASTFANPQIIELLKTQTIPVALDQAYQRRQEDAEGRFYRRIAQQGRPAASPNDTTQGLYLAAADGTLLGFTNNRGSDRVLRMIQNALQQQPVSDVSAILRGKADVRYNPEPPAGGLIVRVHAKILDGYHPPRNAQEDAFQNALSRDNLWITAREHQELLQGRFADSLLKRIAKYHLVDNTRGEPPMWNDKEIQSASVVMVDGRVKGSVRLATRGNDRTYDASLYGVIEHDGQRVTRLDMVAKGIFRGEGPYTRGAPKEPFPLAVSLILADGTDPADAIPPQGSRGWVAGYLE